MKIVRGSSEEEMILAFLSAELESQRFGEDIKETLKKLGAGEELILNRDLSCPEENRLRREVLGKWRGYGRNDGMFERFPNILRWDYALLEEEDIDKIRYINYSYWNELSQNTGLAREAAKTIESGTTIFGISNQPFLQGRDYLLKGNSFRPMILITGGDDQYTIVEGHSRMTVYGLLPEKLAGSYCYIGLCSKEELRAWRED